MKIEQILPYTQMVIAFGAGIVYLCVGNYRMGLYWIFAGALTATIIVGR